MPRLLVATALVALALPAFAIDGEPVPPRPIEVSCPDGRVWNPGARECQEPSLRWLDDDGLFEAARSAAADGQYATALAALGAMSDPEAPRVLTQKGFVHRLNGDWALGRRFYERALAADPDDHLARSYLGIGFVQAGDLGAARVQLAEIRARGGAGSEAEAALVEALAGGRTGY